MMDKSETSARRSPATGGTAKRPSERPGQPGGRRDTNRRERTKALSDAALALFLARGIEVVTIEDITTRAGVAKGSFYRYFDDKQALVEALFAPVASKVMAAFDESIAKLRDAVKDRIVREHHGMTRQKLKRALLDELDRLHKFEPPPSLVEEEFDRVWKSVLSEMENEKKTFADENTTEEKAKAEYRAISERRVRLGLVLAEIGEKNSITVTDDEMNRAVIERVRQFPGQEQKIYDYLRQNPQALAAMRAPIFEEKVVDFLLELASVTENKVAREELYKEEESVT